MLLGLFNLRGVNAAAATLVVCAEALGASEPDAVIVRGYEGNGGITAELAAFGTPGHERALLKLDGLGTQTDGRVHQVSVRRTPVGTAYVEEADGVSRILFEVRLHQGFILHPDHGTYVLGESARIENTSQLGVEAQRIQAAERGLQHAPTENLSSIKN